jgi:hypothetical protein
MYKFSAKGKTYYPGENPNTEEWTKIAYFGIIRLPAKTVKNKEPELQKGFDAFIFSHDNLKKLPPKEI